MVVHSLMGLAQQNGHGRSMGESGAVSVRPLASLLLQGFAQASSIGPENTFVVDPIDAPLSK